MEKNGFEYYFWGSARHPIHGFHIKRSGLQLIIVHIKSLKVSQYDSEVVKEVVIGEVKWKSTYFHCIAFSIIELGISIHDKGRIPSDKFEGLSQLDNSDGVSVNMTILNSTGGVVVSRNAAAGVYLTNMSIVMREINSIWTTVEITL